MRENNKSLNINKLTNKPHGCNVTIIHNKNYSLMEEQDCPVLLGCIRKDNRTMEHISFLQRAAEQFEGRLGVYLALDESIPFLNRRYHVYGTPSFLLLKKGKVKDSLLGIIDYDVLCRALQDTFFIPASQKESL